MAKSCTSLTRQHALASRARSTLDAGCLARRRPLFRVTSHHGSQTAALQPVSSSWPALRPPRAFGSLVRNRYERSRATGTLVKRGPFGGREARVPSQIRSVMSDTSATLSQLRREDFDYPMIQACRNPLPLRRLGALQPSGLVRVPRPIGYAASSCSNVPG